MIRRNEMILAKNCYYDLDCYKTQLNNNVLVVGASGTGKTRGIVEPNILQACGSYVISDPKGNLYNKYREYLKQQGYVVKVAHMLMHADEEEGGGRNVDPFWKEAGELLIASLLDYLRNVSGKEKTLSKILQLLERGVGDSEDPAVQSALDVTMENHEKHHPNSYAYRQYRKVRLAAARTWRSVLVVVNALLGRFDFQELNEMMRTDDMELASIGQCKTAVFVVVSDTDRSLDNLVNLFFTQTMNELCLFADQHCENNRLPVDVRFIMDDFATNCRISEFPRMISSIRSRGISTMLDLPEGAGAGLRSELLAGRVSAVASDANRRNRGKFNRKFNRILIGLLTARKLLV